MQNAVVIPFYFRREGHAVRNSNDSTRHGAVSFRLVHWHVAHIYVKMRACSAPSVCVAPYGPAFLPKGTGRSLSASRRSIRNLNSAIRALAAQWRAKHGPTRSSTRRVACTHSLCIRLFRAAAEPVFVPGRQRGQRLRAPVTKSEFMGQSISSVFCVKEIAL